MLNRLLILCSILVMMALASCNRCGGINCANGGECDKGECVCPDGYSGGNCEIEDKCSTRDVTCENGGTCIDGECDCKNGFSGKSCQNEDLCITNDITCENGECEDGRCDCPPYFTGDRCQFYSPPNPCEGVVCKNDQPCDNGLCDCDEFTKGDSCEFAVIDKYINSGSIDGSWYYKSNGNFLSGGYIQFNSNNDGPDQLDLEYEIVGLNQEVYCEFSDTLTLDIPSQAVDQFTIEGEGDFDGFDWYIEIDDGSEVYYFEPF